MGDRQPVVGGEQTWTSGSALREAETAGRSLSPCPDVGRSLGKNLLCSAREGCNNIHMLFSIFPNLAFVVVKLQPALLPVCLSVLGEHR